MEIKKFEYLDLINPKEQSDNLNPRLNSAPRTQDFIKSKILEIVKKNNPISLMQLSSKIFCNWDRTKMFVEEMSELQLVQQRLDEYSQLYVYIRDEKK